MIAEELVGRSVPVGSCEGKAVTDVECDAQQEGRLVIGIEEAGGYLGHTELSCDLNAVEAVHHAHGRSMHDDRR
jgi:hypothetical protein